MKLASITTIPTIITARNTSSGTSGWMTAPTQKIPTGAQVISAFIVRLSTCGSSRSNPTPRHPGDATSARTVDR